MKLINELARIAHAWVKSLVIISGAMIIVMFMELSTGGCSLHDFLSTIYQWVFIGIASISTCALHINLENGEKE